MSRAALAPLFASLVAAFAGCASAPRPNYDYRAEQVQQAEYHVGPGDVLKVNVWKNEQLTQQLAVRPDGAITLPLLGDVNVAGKTLAQVDAAIAQQGARFFTEPLSVTTQVLEVKSYRVYVLGEVQKPGEFAPASAVTVMQALSLGGGFTRFASPDEITIIRKDAKGVRRIPFVWTQVVKNGDMQENVMLESGDTVVVP